MRLMAVVVRNRFYFSIAVALAMLLTLGFLRTYYARPLFDLPPLSTLLQVHGAVFTAWFLLFLVQTRLIAAHNIKSHKTLGTVGAGLAVLVVIVGTMTAFSLALASRPPAGPPASQFLMVALPDIVMFAAFVGAALALRKRPALHKRFMVLAMISVLGPAVGRLIVLAEAFDYFPLIQTAVPALFVGWCLINDWRRHHIVHPVFVYGGAFIILSWPLRMAFARTEAWAAIYGSIERLVN
jgi:hypothetical protein